MNNNFIFIILILGILTITFIKIYNFLKKPTEEQILKIKEWLLYAITLAEKQFGSGTGQIKLRYVYDMFIDKFPYLSKIISFNVFSSYVDEVLETFKNTLKSNFNLQEYIGGKNNG